MAKGHFIRLGDETTCGGKVLEADTRVMMFGIAHAREGDRVSCGKNDETYKIVGGVSYINSHGRIVAGSLDSYSTCPCRARLIPSVFNATYESSARLDLGEVGADPVESARPLLRPHGQGPQAARQGTRRVAAHGGHHRAGSGIDRAATKHDRSTHMREWIWRLRAMLRRDRMTADMQEELQFHHDLSVEAGLRRGLSEDDARRRARHRAGLVSHGVESTREAMGVRWLDGALADVRHAVRALTRNRGFGTVAVVVLAASVAINTLIFFMLEGVVLRPLPYGSPERLVRLYEASEGQPKFPLSIGRFLDYRANAGSLEAIALYTGQDVELSGADGRSQLLTGVAITSDYFSVLGKAPALGRAFTDADLRRGTRYAILSHRLWQDRFQSDPAIVGKAIRLDRTSWTIVGVAPAGFQHVGGEYRSPLQGESVDVWLPLALDLQEGPLRGAHFCNAIARVRQGVTEAQAREELGRIADAYSKRYPNFGAWRARVEPLLGEVTGRSSQIVWLLMGAGGLVLLVACANIAGLSMARAVARRKELSLRRALGANRWQLVRVGLAENLVVGVVGAVLGLLLAGAGLPLLRQLLPADFPRAHEIALTVQGGLFAVVVAIATVLVAGLLPSLGSDTSPSTPADHRGPRLAPASHGARRRGDCPCRRPVRGRAVPAAQLRGDWRARSWIPGPGDADVPHHGSAQQRDEARRRRAGVRGHSLGNPRDSWRRPRLAPRPTCPGAATTRTPASPSLAGRWTRTTRPGAPLSGGRPRLFRRDGHAAPGWAPLRPHARCSRPAVDAHRQRCAGQSLLSARRCPGLAREGLWRRTADRRRGGGHQGLPRGSRRQAGVLVPARSGRDSPVFFAVRTSGLDPASLTSAVTAAVHARRLRPAAGRCPHAREARRRPRSRRGDSRSGCSRPLPCSRWSCRRPASTGCSPTSSDSGGRSSASEWRSARAAGRC